MFSIYWPYINSILRKTFSFTKKAVIIVGTFFIIISLFLHFINKDKPQATQPDVMEKNRQEIYKIINDPKLNSTKEGKASIAIIQSVMCGLVGEACTDNPKDNETNFNHSLFGFMANLIALPYVNPPASGVYWVANGLQNAGFIPKTYAAEGIGFASIRGLMNIWKALRNVSYMILVLVIVAIGFMIMFRIKLNPQTVISIESSLPKIVMALILITFSFAIVGFMIDLMYVLIILIIAILGSADPGFNVISWQSQYLQAGPGSIFGGIIGPNIGTVLLALPNALLNLMPVVGRIVKYLGSFVGFIILYPLIKGQFESTTAMWTAAIPTPGTLPAGIAGFFVHLGNVLKLVLHTGTSRFLLLLSMTIGANLIIPLFIGLIILITVVFVFFRIFFILFGAYTKIILYIIISPIYLLLEAIPGQNSFSSWMKNLLSQLIIFPTAIAIFVAGDVIIRSVGKTDNFFQLPFIYGINAQSMATLITMAILFITPELLQTVQKLIVPKPFPVEAGLGSFFSGAKTAVGTSFEEINKYSLFAQSFIPLKKVFGKLSFMDKSKYS